MPWQQFADAIALFKTWHNEIKSDRNGFECMRLINPQALGAHALVDATTNLFRRSDNDVRIRHRLVDLEVLVTSTFLAFEASEPRDIIFAVLSLARDTMPRPKAMGHALAAKELSPPPNPYSIYLDDRIALEYEKSLTDVCIDFMEYCMETSQSLDILCHH